VKVVREGYEGRAMKKFFFILLSAGGIFLLFSTGERLGSPNAPLTRSEVEVDGKVSAWESSTAMNLSSQENRQAIQTPASFTNARATENVTDEFRFSWLYGTAALLLMVLSIAMIWKRKQRQDTEVNLKTKSRFGEIDLSHVRRPPLHRRQKEKILM